MNIYLVRHGETIWNKDGRIQGREDVPLNEKGIELAEITSKGMKEIPFDVIYSSPLIRARKTAEIMRGERICPIHTDERLREMSFGRYEGSLILEAAGDESHPLHDFIKNPGRYHARDGEDFIQVIARARSFIHEVLLPLAGHAEHVMIASHGALIRCFLRCIEERPLAEFWGGTAQRNCAVTHLELEEGRFRIVEEGRLYYEIQPDGSFRL